ncbi:hypothetical protein IAQ61_001468 [Plenodomus lingam]|uniref:uncharacterized protein n=1 Tax=Leptosphaeria maculans TaxID=5022 RepID=UPI003329D0BD|nr:hypothetical protein IAQ61_001468 [Plenodomus lingam]
MVRKAEVCGECISCCGHIDNAWPKSFAHVLRLPWSQVSGANGYSQGMKAAEIIEDYLCIFRLVSILEQQLLLFELPRHGGQGGMVAMVLTFERPRAASSASVPTPYPLSMGVYHHLYSSFPNRQSIFRTSGARRCGPHSVSIISLDEGGGSFSTSPA